MALPLEILHQIFGYLPDEKIIEIYTHIPQVRGFGSPLLKESLSVDQLLKIDLATGLRYKLDISNFNSHHVTTKMLENAYELHTSTLTISSLSISFIKDHYTGRKLRIVLAKMSRDEDILRELRELYDVEEVSSNDEPIVHVFARNFNFLRIMAGMSAGMSGIRYSY